MTDNKNEKSAPYNYVVNNYEDQKHLPMANPLSYVDIPLIQQGSPFNIKFNPVQRTFKGLTDDFFRINRQWYLELLLSKSHELGDNYLLFNGDRATELDNLPEPTNKILKLYIGNDSGKQAEKDIRTIIGSDSAEQDEEKLSQYLEFKIMDFRMQYIPVVSYLIANIKDVFTSIPQNAMLRFDFSFNRGTFPDVDDTLLFNPKTGGYITASVALQDNDVNSDIDDSYRIITESEEATDLIIKLFNEGGVTDENIPKYTACRHIITKGKDKGLCCSKNECLEHHQGSIPDIKIPDVKIPDIKTIDVKIPDGGMIIPPDVEAKRWAIARQIYDLSSYKGRTPSEINAKISRLLAFIQDNIKYFNLETYNTNQKKTANTSRFIYRNDTQRLCSPHDGKAKKEDFNKCCKLMAELRAITPVEQRDFKAPVLTITKRNTISQEDKDYLFELSQGMCYCCNKSITKELGKMGHIISHHFGGTETLNNLRYVCDTCNSDMGTSDMYEFIIHNKLNSQHFNNDKTVTDIANRVKYIELGLFLIDFVRKNHVGKLDDKYLSEYKKHTIEERVERAQKYLG